jgi:hypothetical protein
VRCDIPINSETLLTDFMNFRIKSVQSFKYTYKNKIYVRVFIKISDRISIYVYLKKKNRRGEMAQNHPGLFIIPCVVAAYEHDGDKRGHDMSVDQPR